MKAQELPKAPPATFGTCALSLTITVFHQDLSNPTETFAIQLAPQLPATRLSH